MKRLLYAQVLRPKSESRYGVNYDFPRYCLKEGSGPQANYNTLDRDVYNSWTKTI